MNKKAVKALSLTLSAMFVASACYSLTGCKKKNKKDSIVLMTEELFMRRRAPIWTLSV